MPPRTARTRSARSSLPLALSLLAHAALLATLVCFAPLAARPERESPPVTVRFVQHRSPPADELAPAHSADRRALPPEQACEPVAIESQDEPELPEETYCFASELPAAARRGSIGVGASGALRVPHARAIPGEERDGSPAPAATAAVAGTLAPAAGANAPREETTPPIPLECRAPEYPGGAATVSEGGRVRLEILVGSDGRVESVRVLRSSGFARLDEAAESGVRNWRFRPARRAGNAVAWRLEHTIVFRVETGR